MNERLTDIIVRLETRTRQLLMAYNSLLQQKVQLQECLEEKNSEVLVLRERNEQLQKQYDHLKMAKYLDMADDDAKDLRGRIRKMVRDVDRCISMLKVEES